MRRGAVQERGNEEENMAVGVLMEWTAAMQRDLRRECLDRSILSNTTRCASASGTRNDVPGVRTLGVSSTVNLQLLKSVLRFTHQVQKEILLLCRQACILEDTKQRR